MQCINGMYLAEEGFMYCSHAVLCAKSTYCTELLFILSGTIRIIICIRFWSDHWVFLDISVEAVEFCHSTFLVLRIDVHVLGRGGQLGELRSHFSRKLPACLSLPGGFGSAQGSDWQTLTDRLTFTQRFLPALPGILPLRVLIFLPKPFHSQCIKGPHQPPSFNLARVFFPLSKQIWVGSFN